MSVFHVEVKQHFTVNVTYEIEAENEWYLDEALKENSPSDVGHAVSEESPEETYLEILEVHEVKEK